MSISTVGEYLNIIKKMNIDHSSSYYRGQSSHKYKVSSNLYRYFETKKKDDFNIKNRHKFTDTVFKEFLDQFPIYSDIHTLKDYCPNELDLLIAAQHYGLKTRLIDFSKNPLVALYFATEKFNHDTEINKDEKVSIIVISNTSKNLLQECSTINFFEFIEFEKSIFNELYLLTLSGGLRAEDNNYLSNEEIEEYKRIYYKSMSMESLGAIHPMITKNLHSQKFFNKNNIVNLKAKKIKKFDILNDLDITCLNFSRKISSILLANKNKYIFNPLPNTARIRNQQGVLLFSNNINDPLYTENDFEKGNIIQDVECINNLETDLGYYRIDIDSKYASSIKKELEIYGITEEFIYPEINSFTKNLPDRILLKMNKEDDFMEKITIADLNNGI